MLKKSHQKVYSNTGNEDVLSLIEEHPKGGRILDIGCGDGSLAKILIKKGFTIDGITISENERVSASKFMEKVYIFNLEEGLPLGISENQYSYIICSHVLEHIAYPEKLLQDIKKALINGGHLIVALPNIMHYKSRLKLLFGNFDYEETGIWDFTHLRWYTFRTAKNLLESLGFDIIVAKVTGELPFNSLFSKILPKALAIPIFQVLTTLSKGFWGYQLLFKVKK